MCVCVYVRVCARVCVFTGRQVRPFVYKEISLANSAIDPAGANVLALVTQHLEDQAWPPPAQSPTPHPQAHTCVVMHL